MEILVSGLVVFFMAHLLPTVPALRNTLNTRLGAGTYKLLFSLVSFAGLGLIVAGMRSAEYVELWSAPYAIRTVTSLAMLVALFCFISMVMETNLRRYTAHPMNWGVALWATGHIATNGDVASILLFGSFLAYSLFDIWSANLRGAEPAGKKVSLRNDAIALLAGSVVFIAMVFTHGYFAGVSLM